MVSFSVSSHPHLSLISSQIPLGETGDGSCIIRVTGPSIDFLCFCNIEENMVK